MLCGAGWLARVSDSPSCHIWWVRLLLTRKLAAKEGKYSHPAHNTQKTAFKLRFNTIFSCFLWIFCWFKILVNFWPTFWRLLRSFRRKEVEVFVGVFQAVERWAKVGHPASIFFVPSSYKVCGSYSLLLTNCSQFVGVIILCKRRGFNDGDQFECRKGRIVYHDHKPYT